MRVLSEVMTLLDADKIVILTVSFLEACQGFVKRRNNKYSVPPPSLIQTRGAKLPKFTFERRTHKKIMLPSCRQDRPSFLNKSPPCFRKKSGLSRMMSKSRAVHQARFLERFKRQEYSQPMTLVPTAVPTVEPTSAPTATPTAPHRPIV